MQALNVQVGSLHAFSSSLHTPGLRRKFVRAVVIVTSLLERETESRGIEKKKLMLFQGKEGGKMATTPLDDPQSSSLEAYRLTSVKA